jgi:3-oxoacyl-[acyl-carrier protein] reductase
MARRFAEEGARVVLDDVDEVNGPATAAEIRAAGGEAVFLRADVSRADEVQGLIEATVAQYGGLDILVNNAVCAAEHTMLNHWQPILEIALKGAWLCSQAAVPVMQAAGGGCIINISSVNALLGLGEQHLYSAAKAGLIGLTRSFAVRYGPDQIRVNCICPGSIQTEIWEPILAANPQVWEQIVRWYPLGRLGRPEDIANAALFLASDEASFVTGAVFVIDGGLTAGLKEWRYDAAEE